jgi:hypothetical protein
MYMTLKDIEILNRGKNAFSHDAHGAHFAPPLPSTEAGRG